MIANALPNLASYAETVFESLNDHASMCGFNGDEATALQLDPHLDALDVITSITRDVHTTEDILQEFDLGLPAADTVLDTLQKLLIDLTFLSAKIIMAKETVEIANTVGDFYEDEGLIEAAQGIWDEMISAMTVQRDLAREARHAGASLGDILNATTGDPGTVTFSR